MLLFLDIDGVMVPGASWKTPENLEDGFPMFSSKAVEALKRLVSNDTKVILTTSHKSRFTPVEWKKIFQRRGIKVNKLSCLDPNPSFLKRKDELLNWFDVHKTHEDFIIIDDDSSLHALPARLKEHLIVTSSLVGLTQEHLAQASTVLGKRLQSA